MSEFHVALLWQVSLVDRVRGHGGEAQCWPRQGEGGILGYISKVKPVGLADSSNVEYELRMTPGVCN